MILKVYNCIKNIPKQCFPSYCILCDTNTINSYCFCDACLNDLPVNLYFCDICAIPLPQTGLCGQCTKSPPAFDKAYSLYHYEYPLDHLISDFKYQGKLVYGYNLATVSSERSMIFKADYLVPVPLHPKRQRQRGFNQASILAQTLSKRWQIPIARKACERIRDTAHQMELSAKQRQRNLKNAFIVNPKFQAGKVIVVDDVMTTGATANEIAKTLKQSGVKIVYIWTIARTGLQ